MAEEIRQVIQRSGYGLTTSNIILKSGFPADTVYHYIQILKDDKKIVFWGRRWRIRKPKKNRLNRPQNLEASSSGNKSGNARRKKKPVKPSTTTTCGNFVTTYNPSRKTTGVVYKQKDSDDIDWTNTNINFEKLRIALSGSDSDSSS